MKKLPIITALLLASGLACNNPEGLENHILKERLRVRSQEKIYNLDTNIPVSYMRKEQINFGFKKQRLPFLLGEEYKVNDIQTIEKFLENDDNVIEEYFKVDNYPYYCFGVNHYAKAQMEKMGISVALIRGEYLDKKFSATFQYGYILDSIPLDKVPSTTPHWYVVGKVQKDNLINEFIFDYAADQFANGSIVPIVGSRDALRSLYVNMSNVCPLIDKNPI